MWDEWIGLLSEGRLWFTEVGSTAICFDRCEKEREGKREVHVD
jgi:hypothetical protein